MVVVVVLDFVWRRCGVQGKEGEGENGGGSEGTGASRVFEPPPPPPPHESVLEFTRGFNSLTGLWVLGSAVASMAPVSVGLLRYLVGGFRVGEAPVHSKRSGRVSGENCVSRDGEVGAV